MFRPLPHVLALCLLSACNVTSVGPEDAPPRLEVDGLIEGHAAFGFRDERQFLSFDLLDGRSPGSVAELTVWKLFRVELGALGLGIGIGPFDLALGTLFYEPELPEMVGAHERASSSTASSADECELCRKAREEAGKH